MEEKEIILWESDVTDLEAKQIGDNYRVSKITNMEIRKNLGGYQVRINDEGNYEEIYWLKTAEKVISAVKNYDKGLSKDFHVKLINVDDKSKTQIENSLVTTFLETLKTL